VGSLAVNAWAVQSLARSADAVGAVLVHYSTDFVFDGESDRPYTETDRPAPPNVYGQTKLVGEWLAAEARASYVLRVESLFGGPSAHSSIDRIVASLRAGVPARVFVDRVVTPSYVEDVVEATWQLVESRGAFGTYHVVNSGETTWHGLGEEIARLLGVEPNLIGVRLADMQLKARRPRYCALSNDKLRAAGIQMPTWQDALRRHLQAHP
jgi:dTDP-4-dehydrorhamnose reductase